MNCVCPIAPAQLIRSSVLGLHIAVLQDPQRGDQLFGKERAAPAVLGQVASAEIVGMSPRRAPYWLSRPQIATTTSRSTP